jgi:hypothetical protein
VDASNPRFDVYLSYSNSDQEWVDRYLVPRLKQAELSYLTDYDQPGGQLRVTWLETVLRDCRFVLLIMSPRSARDGWQLFQGIQTLTNTIQTGRWTTVPVLIDDCTLPQWLSSLSVIDLRDPANQPRWRQLIATTLGGKSENGKLPKTAAERKASVRAQMLVRTFKKKVAAFELERAEATCQSIYDEQLNSWVPRAVPVMEDVLAIAIGELDAQMERNFQHWQNPYAAALIHGYETCMREYPEETLELRDRLLKLKLSTQLETQLQEMGSYSTRRWPALRKGRDIPVSTSRFIEARLGGVDPFASLKAEEDGLAFRKEKPLFWDLHPVFQNVCGSERPVVVEGKEGAGKSAMAQALRVLEPDPAVLTGYLPGNFEERHMLKCLTQELLNFIAHHPDHLAGLPDNQMKLLGSGLAAGIGKDALLARISKIKKGLSRKKIAEVGVPWGQKGPWLETSGHYLKALERSILSSKGSDNQHYQWAVISECASALGFKRVRLLLDINETLAPDMRNDVFSQLHHLKSEGIVLILFVERVSDDEKKFPARLMRLTWNREQLNALVEHRLHAAAGDLLGGRSVFYGNALQKLLDESLAAGGPPRRFMEIWQQIIRNVQKKKNKYITNKLVTSAYEDLLSENPGPAPML